MTDPIEDDVREALHRKAQFVSDQAIERLSSTDYNLRTTSWQKTVRASLVNFARALRRHR
jgi:hypothetical protein